MTEVLWILRVKLLIAKLLEVRTVLNTLRQIGDLDELIDDWKKFERAI